MRASLFTARILSLAVMLGGALSAHAAVKRYIDVDAQTSVDGSGKVIDSGVTYQVTIEDEGVKPSIVNNLSRSNGTRALKYTCKGGGNDVIKDKTETWLYNLKNVHTTPQNLYQGFSVFIPTDFPNPNGNFWIFWENKQEGAVRENPIITLAMSTTSIQAVVKQSADSTPESGTTQQQTFTLAPISGYKGQWVDFVMHVKFPYATGGAVEVWMKKSTEQNYAKVLNYSGPSGYWNYPSEYKLKFGIYRGWDNIEQTLYFDELRVGDTFAEVDPSQSAGGPVNLPPVVDAGADAVILFPAGIARDASVNDDGLPSGSVTTLWSKTSGPGPVTFANPAAIDTSATFSTPGNYVLTLTASDGALSGAGSISVVVNAQPSTKVDRDLRPLADGMVRDGTYAGDNFGSDNFMMVKTTSTSGNTRHGYVQFDATALPAAASRVWLRLTPSSVGDAVATATFRVFPVANDGWTEGGLTWSNKPPASGTELGSFTGAATGQSIDIEVTSGGANGSAGRWPSIAGHHRDGQREWCLGAVRHERERRPDAASRACL